MRRVREIIELPLKYPEVFERLGIDAPKGVLLYGPPGCGKTLIARAVAHETDANFFPINGPEIIHKFYGESEAHLRKMFEEAAAQGAGHHLPRRDRRHRPEARAGAVGEVEKRVVAQLLALMDGLDSAPARDRDRRHQPPQRARPGAAPARALRPRDRDPHPGHATAGGRSWKSTAAACRWPKTST